jgi:nucleoside-diphosphate-sugar epimerase
MHLTLRRCTMRIAITGATGFLGRYIVRHLVEQGHSLRCWYRPTSDRSGFEREAKSLEWLEGRLGDPASTWALVRGVDAVVHAALEWQREGGFRSSGHDDLAGFLEANLMGSLQLFQTARMAGAPRFVFISTCAVHEVILNDRPLDEKHPLWATSHYGAHKGALEKFVHSYGLGESWAICALRPTGIYGLAHPARNSRWFDLVGQVVRGEAINSARGGKEVHALDVARAVALLLQADEKAIAGQAFNCYDCYIAEQEVARIAKEISGSSSSIADLNKGPKNQIVMEKIRGLGMTFGGTKLLKNTVKELVDAQT